MTNLIESILTSRGGWMLAREIAESQEWIAANPGMYLGAAERMIRQAARDSGGRILSYPGSPGYKLRSLATKDEIHCAVNKIRSQAHDMLRHANEIERREQYEMVLA